MIRGSEKAELADYNYANCHFKTKRYIEAAGYFSTFYRTYNRSPLAEEALFMNAYSLYLDAPDFNLDQQSSQEAVSAIQQFVTVFPGSASYERAMVMLNDLQKRFEELYVGWVSHVPDIARRSRPVKYLARFSSLQTPILSAKGGSLIARNMCSCLCCR